MYSLVAWIERFVEQIPAEVGLPPYAETYAGKEGFRL